MSAYLSLTACNKHVWTNGKLVTNWFSDFSFKYQQMPKKKQQHVYKTIIWHMIICTRSLFVWTSFCVVFNRFLWIGFCAVLLCCVLFCFVVIMIEMPAKVNKAKPKGIQKHAATITESELHQTSQATEMLLKQAIKPLGWYICYVVQKQSTCLKENRKYLFLAGN